MLNNITIPKSISEYCDVRESVRDKLKKAFELLKSSDNEFKTIYQYGISISSKPNDSLETIYKQIDTKLWRVAFDKTGLSNYFDRETKRQFESDIESNPPEFTVSNIRETLLSSMADSENLFQKSIVETFRILSREHKTNTNEPFKVNEKAILQYMVTLSFSHGRVINCYNGANDTINDIDRVFKILDDKQFIPRSLEQKINLKFKDNENYEDEYYIFKGYKNGNLHILFKRDDLLIKANKMIAKYYGEVLK